MKKIFLIVATVVSSFILNAQQDAHYSFYMFNGLYLNPAYAGSHDVVNVMAIGRKQWTNIAGAPTSASVSIHSPLAKSKGVRLVSAKQEINHTHTKGKNKLNF